MTEKITYTVETENGTGKEGELDLKRLKDTVYRNFEGEKVSDNAKQKLVYNLLNTIKSNNQKDFFWILLKQINSPEFQGLSYRLKEDYQILPENLFINYAYTVILGIMSTYKSNRPKKEGENNE